jgi:hypothetical protein
MKQKGILCIGIFSSLLNNFLYFSALLYLSFLWLQFLVIQIHSSHKWAVFLFVVKKIYTVVVSYLTNFIHQPVTSVTTLSLTHTHTRND